METRTIIQGKIYGLFMNPISGRHEESVPVAASSDYQTLVNWYNSQRCEMWRDDWMNKQFRKGSPLEYYNALTSTELNPNDHWHHGIYSEWIQLNEIGKPTIHPSVTWLG